MMLIRQIKLILLFFLVSTATGILSNAGAQQKGKVFSVDTLFTVVYGDSAGMIWPPWGPSLFRATKHRVYIILQDRSVLIYGNDGKFIDSEKLPFNTSNCIDFSTYKTDFIIIGLSKIYRLDSSLEQVDTIDYYDGSMLGRHFTIFDKIYFENFKEPEYYIVFNAENNSFNKVTPESIWKTDSAGCLVVPFTQRKDIHQMSYSGASKNIIIIEKNLRGKVPCRRIFSIINTEKCETIELDGFCYEVHPTISPKNEFQFINDTTAIFNVRYYNKDDMSGTECVFYKITFHLK